MVGLVVTWVVVWQGHQDEALEALVAAVRIH